MADEAETTRHYVSAIRESGLTIYDDKPDLRVPTPALESILRDGLVGKSLVGLALRTRSKAVKEWICDVLGYPIPPSFRRTQPRFVGQLLDVYVQRSNNLQIWNEEIAVARRYAIVHVNSDDIVDAVRVVSGDSLRLLDTTGTLTQKYQARLVPGESATELVVRQDTDLLRPYVGSKLTAPHDRNPAAHPEVGQLLSIAELHERLAPLVDATFEDSGSVQERSRGAELHRLACRHLGYTNYHDDGRYPDVRHQLLEIKLQTSPTIDLGLVSPDSIEPAKYIFGRWCSGAPL